jgi:hypothetical protein
MHKEELPESMGFDAPLHRKGQGAFPPEQVTQFAVFSLPTPGLTLI